MIIWNVMSIKDENIEKVDDTDNIYFRIEETALYALWRLTHATRFLKQGVRLSEFYPKYFLEYDFFRKFILDFVTDIKTIDNRIVVNETSDPYDYVIKGDDIMKIKKYMDDYLELTFFANYESKQYFLRLESAILDIEHESSLLRSYIESKKKDRFWGKLLRSVEDNEYSYLNVLLMYEKMNNIKINSLKTSISGIQYDVSLTGENFKKKLLNIIDSN